MRVLYLTHSCPYPPNKGDRIRSFHLLRHLSSQYEVTLIYPSFSAHEAEQLEVLKQYCHTVFTVRLYPVLAKINCLLALWRGGSLTTAYFQSQKLQQMVEHGSFDMAVADCSSMAPYILEFPQPKIVDFVDVDSEKWKIYSKSAFFPFSWIYHLESQRLGIYEEEIVNRAQACLITSDKERQSLPPTGSVLVVPNGVDFNYFKPDRPVPPTEIPTLLFMGAMDYFANIDGVLFFYEEILPIIKQMVPQVKFIIAGMNPVKKIQQLAGQDIIVTGFVPDMRAYLNAATVCVTPLRIARGVQNKVLEAMAMNVPVVSTTAANGGIAARDGQEILLADSPETFAEAVVSLLQDAQFCDLLAARARNFVEARFTWEHSFSKINEALALALEKKSS